MDGRATSKCWPVASYRRQTARRSARADGGRAHPWRSPFSLALSHAPKRSGGPARMRQRADLRFMAHAARGGDRAVNRTRRASASHARSALYLSGLRLMTRNREILREAKESSAEMVVHAPFIAGMCSVVAFLSSMDDREQHDGCGPRVVGCCKNCAFFAAPRRIASDEQVGLISRHSLPRALSAGRKSGRHHRGRPLFFLGGARRAHSRSGRGREHQLILALFHWHSRLSSSTLVWKMRRRKICRPSPPQEVAQRARRSRHHH